MNWTKSRSTIYMVENCVIFIKIHNYIKQSLGKAYPSCFDLKSNVIRNGGFSFNSGLLIKIVIQDMQVEYNRRKI